MYFSFSKYTFKFPGSYIILFIFSFTLIFIKDCAKIDEFVLIIFPSSQNKKLHVAIICFISFSFKNPSSSIYSKKNKIKERMKNTEQRILLNQVQQQVINEDQILSGSDFGDITLYEFIKFSNLKSVK